MGRSLQKRLENENEKKASPVDGLNPWSPTGRASGTSMKYPPTPLGAEALRCASAKASEGYPPIAKSAEASMLRYVKD
jgi:hypothetical protein